MKSLFLLLTLFVTFHDTTATLTSLNVTNHITQNYDFPGALYTYSVIGTPYPTIFYNETENMGRCRIKAYAKSVIDLRLPYVAPPEIALLDILSLVRAGCSRYGDVAIQNGWLKDCPGGVSEAIQAMQQPGTIPCSSPETRPQMALYVQQKATEFCCQDPYFSRAFAMFGNKPFDTLSLVPQTGISATTFYAFNASGAMFQYIKIDSEGSAELGTKILYSKGWDFYMHFRLVVCLLVLGFIFWAIYVNIRDDGFRFNLKWGIIGGNLVWSLLVLGNYSMFVHFRFNGYQVTLEGTALWMIFEWIGFLFGYEALCFMLLLWSDLSRISHNGKPLAQTLTKIYKWVTIFSMISEPILLISMVARTLTMKTQSDYEGTILIVEITEATLACFLVIHSLGLLYYGSQIRTVASQASRLTRNPKSTVKPKHSITRTVKYMLLAVVVGWLSVALVQVLNLSYGNNSIQAFWGMGIWYDANFVWIASLSVGALTGSGITRIRSTQGSSQPGTSGSANASGGLVRAQSKVGIRTVGATVVTTAMPTASSLPSVVGNKSSDRMV